MATRLVRHDPWSAISEIQHEINNLIHHHLPVELRPSFMSTEWSPSVDLKEEKDKYIVWADIPGVDIKDIEIEMQGGLLTIKGKKERESKQERENYTCLERFKGSFYRSIALPEAENPEKIIAKSKHGVLEITVPKKKQTQSQKIKVTQED